MWANSVLFYSADNGGTDRGSNWPLRGAKHSNWEGGLRAAAFISGGLIPAHLRGTTSNVVGHIADWYSTICVLAGVEPADDSPIEPLPVDPTRPEQVRALCCVEPSARQKRAEQNSGNGFGSPYDRLKTHCAPMHYTRASSSFLAPFFYRTSTPTARSPASTASTSGPRLSQARRR